MYFQNLAYKTGVFLGLANMTQLSGVVVRMPACCAEGGGSNPGWGAQDFQYRLSSAETQQPVDRMRRKARGCLVLSVLC